MQKPRITLRPMGKKTGGEGTDRGRGATPGHPKQGGTKTSFQDQVRFRDNRPGKTGSVVEGEGKENPTRNLQPFSWMETEATHQQVEWGSPYSGKRSQWGRNSNQSWASLVVSVGGAIVLGTLMGLLILSLFFSGEPLSTHSIDSHRETLPSEMEQAVAGQNGPTVSLPRLKAVLVQGGIFKEKSGADATIRKLRSQGLAAVVTAESPYRIYQGVGLNRDGALRLSAPLDEKKAEIYLKELSVGGKTASLPEQSSAAWKETLPSFVKEGHRIFQSVTRKTVDAVGGKGSVASLASGWGELRQSYERMASLERKTEDGLPENAKPHADQMMRALDQVIQSGEGIGDQPSPAMIWQIQEGLVRYALAYEKFVEAMK